VLPERPEVAELLDELPAFEVWPFSAWYSVRRACATVDVADATAVLREVASSAASCCPAVTRPPSTARTDATFPETGKDTLAEDPGSIVPVEVSTCCTVCVPTTAVR
jgi:hypothetical protein